MATTDTDLPQIIFNELSQAKYDELKAAGQLNEKEFYITPDSNSSNFVTTDTEQTTTAKKTFEDTISVDSITSTTDNVMADNKVNISATNSYYNYTDSAFVEVWNMPYADYADVNIKAQSINNNTSTWSGATVNVIASLPTINLMVGDNLSSGTNPAWQNADNGLKIQKALNGTISAKLVGDKINNIPADSNDGTLVTTAYLNTKLADFSPATITYWN